MTNYGADATNEILNTFIDLTGGGVKTLLSAERLSTTPSGGYVTVLGDGPNAGKAFTPGHAYINVEGGDIRMRCDGQTPDDTLGTLYSAGSVIDWTNPLVDYQALIKNAQIILVHGSTSARLTISFRN